MSNPPVPVFFATTHPARRGSGFATIDRRFWLVAVLGTLLAVVALGVPTAVIPNPFFTRMTPTGILDVIFLAATSPLMGLTLATFVAKPQQVVEDPHDATGGTRTSLAGIGAFLAIGCPICNKIVVGLLGISGTLTVFAPIQPVIGVASVTLLAGTLAYRLRQRTRGCTRCQATGKIGG